MQTTFFDKIKIWIIDFVLNNATTKKKKQCAITIE